MQLFFPQELPESPQRWVNEEVAEKLDEVAMLLQERGGNPYRARAYRNAAATVRRLPRPISRLYAARGLPGLEELAGVGASIARSIQDLLLRGRLPLIEQLRGESDPVGLFSTVPGLGPKLAMRLHDELQLETLEDLEAAAHDGRLERLAGFGRRRVAAIRASLALRLARVRNLVQRPGRLEPPVAELLDIDREYREQTEAGKLRKIAPRRFNPSGEAWLPVFHTNKGPRHYSALFSNTPLAHRLGRTHDWVVISYESDGSRGQFTVVTAHQGPLRGRQVVRGREPECLEFYRLLASSAKTTRPIRNT
jgi:DNA polymerase (family 10)